MTNHLLVETPQGSLSQIIRHVNGADTNYFNTKRKRAGHLLQARYRAVLVEEDEYAKELGPQRPCKGASLLSAVRECPQELQP